MRRVEMIILTRSSKYGQYCVAGVSTEDGRWVRLVSDDEKTHGAVSDEMLYDPQARRHADVLDKIEAETEENVPGPVQTENVLVKGKGKIRILGRVRLEEALRLHPCEERDGLFSSYGYMVEGDTEALHHSLEMVEVRSLKEYTVVGQSGKPKHKADFEYGGRQFTGLAMTDPAYYGPGEKHADRAVLVLSISDDEWSHANGHYIYVARIFDRDAEERTMPLPVSRSRNRRLRGWIAAALAAAAAGLIALAVLMGTVYVTPYTGARYHAERECGKILNPNAVRTVPAIVAKVLWKPCGECVPGE